MPVGALQEMRVAAVFIERRQVAECLRCDVAVMSLVGAVR
jgi:hypothetical protein